MSEPPALPPPNANPPAIGAHAGLFGFLGGLLGGVVVTALVIAGTAAAWPTLRTHLMPPADNHEAAIADLDHRLAALEGSAGKASGDKTALADLAQRIDTLEHASPAAPADDPRIAALTEKTDQLTSQVAALRVAGGEQADLQQLVARAEVAAQTAHDVATKRQSAEALLVIVGQLRDAVERGGPYAGELAAARKVAPADAGPTLDALAATADTGVTRRNDLIDSFPGVASAIARAALVSAAADDFWGHLEQEAATLVTVRRTDGRGNDPASIAARAEKATHEGDLESAVRELSALDGPPAAEAKAWMTAANARLSADRGLSELAARTAKALVSNDD